MVVRTTRTRLTARIPGRVTYQKQRHAPAPSTRAAWYQLQGDGLEGGEEEECDEGHAGPDLGEGDDVDGEGGSVSHWMPSPIRPTLRRSVLMIPKPALKARAHIRPETTAGIAQGTRRTRRH